MIQSASARTRLLTYGASAIALMASMASPAFAQTAAQPGDAQCPIVDGVVTCTGNVAGGFRADRTTGLSGVVLRDLTAPIAPANGSAAIYIRPLGNLDLDLDGSVTIRTANPFAGDLGTRRLRGSVTLAFDPAVTTRARVVSAADIVTNLTNSAGGGFYILEADNVDFTNLGEVRTVKTGTVGTQDSLAYAVLIQNADTIAFRNEGTLATDGSESVTVSLEGRDVRFTNTGTITNSISVDGARFISNRPVGVAVTATPTNAANLMIDNSGTIEGVDTQRDPNFPYYSAVNYSNFAFNGRGSIDFRNSGDLVRNGLNIIASAQSDNDTLVFNGSHTGSLVGSAITFSTNPLSSGLAESPVTAIYRNIDSSFVNEGDSLNGAFLNSASGENVTMRFENRGDLRVENASDGTSVGQTNGSVSVSSDRSIGLIAFGAINGSSYIDMINYGNINISNELQHSAISVDSSHDVRVSNYGNIDFIDYREGNESITIHQGITHFGRGEFQEAYIFDGSSFLLNEGNVEMSGRSGDREARTFEFETVSDGTLTNIGLVSHYRASDYISDNFSSRFDANTIAISAVSDFELNNSGEVTFDISATADAGGAAILIVEQSLSESDVASLSAAGRLRGYDRAKDLASRIEVNLDAGSVAAGGRGSYGIFTVLGLVRGQSGFSTLDIGDFLVANDQASLGISIEDGVSVTGGTFDGIAIGVDGAGRVSLQNSGSIVSRSDETGGALILGRDVGSIYDSDFLDGSFAPVAGLTLDLLDSSNSGAIEGGAGQGILVANGSITNFVNSGTVRGGTGSISSSGRGQVTNLSSGTIDGAVVLSGANSVLTNSGLIRLSGPGAVASTVNGDWMQSTGRLELGLDDTLSVAGNMTLAGELGLTLGTPSSTRIINVGGDLSIDALLDVTGDAGFGQGVYRLFDYGGALSGGGLTVATMPTGTSGTIQTAIAGQINLVVGGGVTPTPDIQFWDGVQTEANGAVNGGAGTWGGTATNWTDMNGAANAAWGSKFAVFQGTPATVTIASEGVSASGLQFAVDGYRVEGGTLTLTAPATLRVGDASAAGAAYTATIASTIAGSGGIDKTDLGTLVLTGANSYTGGTRISGGTLAVGSDGALGAASGGLTFAGGGLRADGAFSSTRAITMNAGGGTIDTQAHSVTLSGSLTGSGALAKAGSGTLTFSGDGSAYTGTLTNRAGTLAIDGSLGGSVTSQGSLLTVGGAVAGDVTVGAGTATIGAPGRIGGDLFATGSATVRLDGTVTGNADIASGARLSGIGRIGGDLILAGTFAPGNSVGAISVGGNATFAAGSVFDLELDADGSGDTLSVMGTTTIAGGTVRITTLDPELDYTDGSEYTFITSAGGLTGTFDSLSETSAFLDFVLGYDGNRAFVTVDVVRTFPDVAQTFNQRQASIGLAALDRAEGSDSLAAYNAILLLDEAPARAAFDASSGEIYPSLLQDLSLTAQARGRSLIVRSHAAAGEGWGLWGGAMGRDGHVAGDGNAARSSFDGYGFELGMDYRGAGNAWAAGARVSWLKTNVQIADRASSASGDGWALGGYARYGTGHAGFSASVAFDYAEASVDTARAMAFGTLSRTTRAALDTNSIATSAELRYGLPVHSNWTVGPVASLDYGRGKIGGFSESGADALDLSSDGARSGATRYGGGAFASWQGEAGAFSLSAQYVTGKDRFADAVLTLDGAPATPFTIRSPLRQADGALLDLTAGFDLGRGWRLGADASALLANGANDLRGRVSIGWQF